MSRIPKSSPEQLASARRRYWSRDARQRFAGRANRKAAFYGRPDDVLDWTTLPAGPWSCTGCGAPCESWDHIQPLAVGGANQPANLMPSCVSCNQRRTARSLRVLLLAIRPAKAFCKRGHAFTAANTRLGTKGERRCRACARIHAVESYHRNRVA